MGLTYRALLRVYPRGRRRAELAGTLMEVGRPRPGPAEALGMVRHGLRARLGRPGQRGVVVLALLVALVTGFGGAALTDRIGWEFVPDHPVGAQRAEIDATLFPGRSVSSWVEPEVFVDVQGGSTGVAALFFGHSDEYGLDSEIMAPAGGYLPGDARAWADATRARLVSAGWQVVDTVPGQPAPEGPRFEARRGGLHLWVNARTGVVGTPPGSFAPEVSVGRIPPGWLTGAGVLAWLVFGLVGWLVAGWVSRRSVRGSDTVQMLSCVPVVLALFVLVPHALWGAVLFVVTGSWFGSAGEPFWVMATVYGYHLVLAGVVGLLVAVGAAATVRPGEDAADRRQSIAY